jgi:hypothetical protein
LKHGSIGEEQDIQKFYRRWTIKTTIEYPCGTFTQESNNRSMHRTEMRQWQGKALTILTPEFGGMSIRIKNIMTGERLMLSCP